MGPKRVAVSLRMGLGDAVLVGLASFSPRLSRPEEEKPEEWAGQTKTEEGE